MAVGGKAVHVNEFLNSVLHRVEWVNICVPAALRLGKERYPRNQWIWGSLCLSLDALEKGKKILPLSGIEPHLLGRSSHTLVHVPTAVFSSHLHFPRKKGYMSNGPVISNTFKPSKISGLSTKVGYCTYWLFKELLFLSNCSCIYPFLALPMLSRL